MGEVRPKESWDLSKAAGTAFFLIFVRFPKLTSERGKQYCLWQTL